MLKLRLQTIRFLLIFFIFICSEVIADDLAGVMIYWKAPTSYSNGNPLKNAKFELSEYRLYFGPSREKVRSKYVTIHSRDLSFPLQLLDLSSIISPIVYLAVTAVSITGQESNLSEIVFVLP